MIHDSLNCNCTLCAWASSNNDHEARVARQAETQPQVRQTRETAVCDDIDLVIESLAANGELEEAERLKKATSKHEFERPTFAAVSDAILDVIDEGFLDHGNYWSWKFDAENEVFANSQRLDFRDAVLARLKR